MSGVHVHFVKFTFDVVINSLNGYDNDVELMLSYKEYTSSFLINGKTTAISLQNDLGKAHNFNNFAVFYVAEMSHMQIDLCYCNKMLRNLTQWVASSFQSSDLPLLPGTDVRGYSIERVLHRGGMSWVYKARDMRGIAVVIKEFFPASSAYRNSNGFVQALPGKADFYKEAYRRFHEEGRCLGMFRGANFPRARTFFRSANTAYIVMEIERGRTLGSYLKIERKPVEWQIARPYILDIKNALLKMHKQNILHLDLHPSNIFLSLNKRGILLDFGAARHAAEPVINTARFVTPGFSAPEIKNGVKWGTWSDIYSLGACLKASGALRNNHWPKDIRVLTLDCMREDIGARLHFLDDQRFDILSAS